MRKVIIDIETGPLLDAELAQFEPKEWPLGNLKDPSKIAQAIEEKRRAWKEGAALDALTGRIIAIGTLELDHITVFADDDEAGTIGGFLTWLNLEPYDWPLLVGFNIKLFDLPFLHRRALKHGRSEIKSLWSNKRPWDSRVIDLREEWQCGDRQAHDSLNSICRHMGIGGKLEDMSGRDFARVWLEDKDKALAYLHNDLRLTEALAKRMGVAL